MIDKLYQDTTVQISLHFLQDMEDQDIIGGNIVEQIGPWNEQIDIFRSVSSSEILG